MPLIVVILTKNEERHIERAIASVSALADRIVVVDSGSEDRTAAIAQETGACQLPADRLTQRIGL